MSLTVCAVFLLILCSILHDICNLAVHGNRKNSNFSFAAVRIIDAIPKRCAAKRHIAVGIGCYTFGRSVHFIISRRTVLDILRQIGYFRFTLYRSRNKRTGGAFCIQQFIRNDIFACLVSVSILLRPGAPYCTGLIRDALVFRYF